MLCFKPNTTKFVSLLPELEQVTNINNGEGLNVSNALNIGSANVTCLDNECDDGLDDITMSDSESEKKHISVTPQLEVAIQLNYKKMLVNELRDLVKVKGLTVDYKKLKKNELVKLLVSNSLIEQDGLSGENSLHS